MCDKSWLEVVVTYGSAFGAGAILMFVFSHVYPEAMEYLELGGLSHSEINWQFATVFMAAFLLGMLIHLVSDFLGGGHQHRIKTDRESTKGSNSDSGNIEMQNTNSSALVVSDTESPSTTLDSTAESATETLLQKESLFDFTGVKPLAWNIILGDFFHNFFDGVMIALGFRYCTMSYGWAILGSILAHEIPQEIADFMILLGAGMTIPQAAFFNFLSACSAFLGVIILLAAGDIPNTDLGFLLAFNCGIFTFVGASELIPTILEGKKKKIEIASVLFFFILGTIVIGLTALSPHLHCDAGGGHDHDHDHDH